MEETELARDFMMALFIGSTALVAVVPVFLSLIRQPNRRSKKNGRVYYSCVKWLFFSFIAGILALVLTWDWFRSPCYWEKQVAAISFGLQIIFLLLGSYFYWHQSIEEN